MTIANVHAQPLHEVRAVWLTTIGGIDWPHTYARSPYTVDEQKKELCDILDRLQRANINTVLIQTRVRGTVIYPSSIEPWDGCLSGNPGTTPGYDALRFAVDECHRRGMECHAWVVTMPVGKWNSIGCRRLRSNNPQLIRRIGDDGYMNPEMPGTADYLARICSEITRNYDVDGIHLDYIRYPETWKIQVPLASGREYITRIVQRVHEAVKGLKPWVKLSCAPIGKFNDLSRYRSFGWNAYTKGCQDAQGWLRQGLMDELFPMMYFQGDQFFPFAVDWQENSHGRIVAPGLGIYFLSPREKNWELGIVQREMHVLRELGLGHAYFRSKFFTDNVKGIYDFGCRFDNYPALIPPMTWLSSAKPSAPVEIRVERHSYGDELSWTGAKDHSGGPYLLYNVYADTKQPVDTHNPRNLVATRWMKTSISIRREFTRLPLYYVVTAVDRYGNESEGCSTNIPSPSIKYATSPRNLGLSASRGRSYLTK